MIDIEHAAHWAELISAIIGSGVATYVLRVTRRGSRTITRVVHSLHEHTEAQEKQAQPDKPLTVEGVQSIFTAKAGD